MPSWPSSQQVSRAPWSSGRVSSTITWLSASSSCSARITPRAEPSPGRRGRRCCSACGCGAARRRRPAGATRRRACGAGAHRVGEPGRRQGRRLDGVAALGYPLRDRQHLAAEVDGRRPGVGDALDLSVQPRPVPALPVALADGQGDAQRAGHAEQRRAAHGERGDRLDQLIDRGDAQHADLMRQHGLVQGLDVPVAPGEHVRCVHTRTYADPALRPARGSWPGAERLGAAAPGGLAAAAVGTRGVGGPGTPVVPRCWRSRSRPWRSRSGRTWPWRARGRR